MRISKGRYVGLAMGETLKGPSCGADTPGPTFGTRLSNEASSLKKQHTAALEASGVAPFVMYTFRHTCITRWAKYMDPFILHVLAGHADMNTTKRYVHPSDADILEAMEKVRVGTKVGTVRQIAVSKSFEEMPVTRGM